MRKINLLLSILTVASAMVLPQNVSAQKKAGDYKESVNNNVDQSRAPRKVQYVPKDGGFFCINGKNRFTRALYGSNTDYRIETSDKPIFAIYKSKNYRNLRFCLENDGKTLQLDLVDYCESNYRNGVRTYKLKDQSWGEKAVLNIEVVALPDAEGAVWKFYATGFDGDVRLISKVCNIANPKLSRNGDMGADKPGVFEPSPTDAGLVTQTFKLKNSTDTYARLDFQTITFSDNDKAVSEMFNSATSYFAELSSRIQFNTPDPWINNLGHALVLAADGCWDGETWLHGAIGWRMPLAGWRAGYLGDVLGWKDRAISHFDAYAASQVTDVPVQYPGAQQDKELRMARAEKKWGTEMYSTGYICRNPNRNNQMHHYDMNLNYIDELLWHFQYDADKDYMRKMWPVLKRHLAWEKMNFDADNNHLYDAYCCIWASDALFYSNGAVTHSSAYNYRGNLLAAKIARLVGEDPTPYQQEADAIRKAMNERLWVEGNAAYIPTSADVDNGKTTGTFSHWAEYQESMGYQRVHPDAALWSVYTPIDCGVGTYDQMMSATKYVTTHIPHIKVAVTDAANYGITDEYSLISTSDWMPYSWSINNVASAEIMHTALAYFEAGNREEGFNLLKSNVMDQMYLGQSPGNFGQINYYDAARGECYRDFGDNVGISSRAIIQGLFGIVPQALDGKCIIQPGFPLEWDSVAVKTPYLSYRYYRVGDHKAVLHVEQNFPQALRIVVNSCGIDGKMKEFAGSTDAVQDIEIEIAPAKPSDVAVSVADNGSLSLRNIGLEYPEVSAKEGKKLMPQNITKYFNAKVSDIFEQEYLSPRPNTTSLELPTQGVGEWCHPKFQPEINDSVFRTLIKDNRFVVNGIPFNTPSEGFNIVYTSLWDNFPAEVNIPVKASKANSAYLLIAGSTNHMQAYLDNALVIAHYADGTTDTLRLLPPFNYCPIEQDYYVDGMAFKSPSVRPVRLSLGTGVVSQDLGEALNISKTEVYGREIPGGAATMLCMPLDDNKKVKSFTLKTTACDVVVGLMGITLMK